ncbi:MAG: outer membrane lipoprotein carrier protein LolA [Gammaproteobacteria bacterium]|nr:outer membrane lipoprotein carrier protein LolA [Gammaproteobacteria bacterium]
MKCLIFFGLLSINCCFSAAATDAANVEIRAFEQVQLQSFNGLFEQVRQLKLIKKPLRSKGVFEVTDAALVWHTKTPFEVEYVINQEVIKETVDGETKIQQLSENQHMQAFAKVFAALIKLDKEVILQNFSIEESLHNDKWQLTLTPISSPIDKVFSKIEISGNSQIEKIKTASHAGDINSIHLSYER